MNGVVTAWRLRRPSISATYWQPLTHKWSSSSESTRQSRRAYVRAHAINSSARGICDARAFSVVTRCGGAAVATRRGGILDRDDAPAVPNWYTLSGQATLADEPHIPNQARKRRAWSFGRTLGFDQVGAREELVAELGIMPGVRGDHTSHIASWLEWQHVQLDRSGGRRR